MTLPAFTFGVEIECYLPAGTSRDDAARAISARGAACNSEHYNHNTRSAWKIVTDGSLQDYTRGCEVVSPVFSGEAGLESLGIVLEALTDLGATVNKECGLHVHVGVGERPASFFKSLWKLYAHFEPVIDGFLPKSRRGSANQYCRSMTRVPFDQIDRAGDLRILLQNLGRHTEDHRHDSRRYHKLNYVSYYLYKTVEFRQHSGTLEIKKATNWIAFCLRMVAAAANGKTIDTFAATMRTPTNTARPGSKAHLVGQLMLRAEGVTSAEAIAATGWPSISLPQQAAACGLTFTTERMGRTVRYYANQAATTTAARRPVSLAALMETIEATAAEAAYFRIRTTNLSGDQIAWAA